MANINANTPQLKVVKQWLDAFFVRDGNVMDPVLSKDFVYETLPKSIGLPDERRERHIQRLNEAFTTVEKFEFIFQEVIEAPGKVVIHATSIFHAGGTKLSYDNVVIVTLAEEDGKLKITRGKEFTDPEKYSALKAAAGGA